MYTFPQVHQVLASLHRAYPDSMKAIRGRIGHFQSLGLSAPGHGRGLRVPYTLESVMRWAYALELSEFGIGITDIIHIVDKTWDIVRLTLIHGTIEDKFLILDPASLSTTYSKQNQLVSYILTGDKFAPTNMYRSLIINLGFLHDSVVKKLEELDV